MGVLSVCYLFITLVNKEAASAYSRADIARMDETWRERVGGVRETAMLLTCRHG